LQGYKDVAAVACGIHANKVNSTFGKIAENRPENKGGVSDIGGFYVMADVLDADTGIKTDDLGFDRSNIMVTFAGVRKKGNYGHG
jgi:hypothetical protein